MSDFVLEQDTLSLHNSGFCMTFAVELNIKHKINQPSKRLSQCAWPIFFSDGLVFQSVTRPDHLDDLLSASIPRPDKGARPKVPKQMKKKDPRQKPQEYIKDDRNKVLDR